MGGRLYGAEVCCRRGPRRHSGVGGERGAQPPASLAARREARLRLFVAVDVPEAHRRSIDTAISSLKAELPEARWSRADSWHLTLKFFGEVAEDDVPALTDRIREATSGVGNVESRLEDMGAFPSTRRARVLWVGVADPESRLSALASAIEQQCGYPPERRFRAHLTVARFKTPRPVDAVIGRHGPFGWDRSEFLIEKATLLRSVLGRAGATYLPIAEFPLQ